MKPINVNGSKKVKSQSKLWSKKKEYNREAIVSVHHGFLSSNAGTDVTGVRGDSLHFGLIPPPVTRAVSPVSQMLTVRSVVLPAVTVGSSCCQETDSKHHPIKNIFSTIIFKPHACLTLGTDDLGSLPGSVGLAADDRYVSLKESIITLIPSHSVDVIM